MDIMTVGEILIDLTQTGTNTQGVPTFSAYPGGAPANVAVAAARLGAQSAFVGKRGRDPLGNYLVQVLTQNGVDTSGLGADASPTTLALVSIDPSGERSFQFLRGADSALACEDIDAALATAPKVLHFGSVSLTREPARSATLYAVRRAREAGALVSYDPNYRAALWDSQAHAVEEMRGALPLADLVKLSEEEVPLLTGDQGPEAGAKRLEERGTKLVLITLGAQGVYYRWQGRTGLVPGVPVHVADTNGAGDTFLGAVLSRLVRRQAGPLERLTQAELEQLLTFANRAAALTCSRSGAIPAMPSLSEVEG